VVPFAFGNRASMIEPRGNVQGANPNHQTNYTYHAAGRILTIQHPMVA
jgi:YD repeat-containing protein